MKRLFYLSASILMLALAFHFGYTTARAQAPGNPIVGIAASANIVGVFVATTDNGDAYLTDNEGTTWTFRGNVFSGGPTPTSQQTWGSLKARYAPNHTPTSQTPTNR
jgi:hypothetical protein